jgi:hypothetical protein
MTFVVQLIIAIVLAAISYALTPKPKQQSSQAKPADLSTPTVSAGRPLPVLFGTVLLQDPNVLHIGEKITTPVVK